MVALNLGLFAAAAGHPLGNIFFADLKAIRHHKPKPAEVRA